MGVVAEHEETAATGAAAAKAAWTSAGVAEREVAE